MATAAKFPAALLALVDVGGEMAGFPEATLSGAHNSSVTTITLTATVPTAWPTAGWVTIDSEIIQYAAKSGATLTGCTRGSQSAYGGSVAASHADQAKVGLYLTPQAWNQLVADLIAVETQLLGIAQRTSSQPWYLAGGSPIESTLVGTGTLTVPPTTSNQVWQMATGATSGGSSALRMTIAADPAAAGVTGVWKLRLWQWWAYFTAVDANTTAYIFMTNENVVGAPSLTARHIGIKSVAGVVSFSTADGTTEQTTDVTAFWAASTEIHVTITFDGTTARLYIDGTLRATHATNVPTTQANTGKTFRAYIVNSAAANKQLLLGLQYAETAV